MKCRDRVYNDLGKGMNSEVIRIFKYLLYMYNNGERSEPEKKIINEIKTTFRPPLLPIKYPRKTPLF